MHTHIHMLAHMLAHMHTHMHAHIHMLILPKQPTKQGPNTQTYEAMGAILMQTTTKPQFSLAY